MVPSPDPAQLTPSDFSAGTEPLGQGKPVPDEIPPSALDSHLHSPQKHPHGIAKRSVLVPPPNRTRVSVHRNPRHPQRFLRRTGIPLHHCLELHLAARAISTARGNTRCGDFHRRRRAGRTLRDLRRPVGPLVFRAGRLLALSRQRLARISHTFLKKSSWPSAHRGPNRGHGAKALVRAVASVGWAPCPVQGIWSRWG